MHILITGGCGYTGTILTNDLISLGYKVTVVDVQWFGVGGSRAELPECWRGG